MILLNDALRDQLAVGLSQDSIQRKLLDENKLTFKKVCEIAQAMELAERNTYDLKAAGSREVQAVSEKHISVKKKTNQPPSTGPKKCCYWCGGQHKAEVRRFHTEKCRKCSKVGHIAKKCRSREMIHQVEEPEETLHLNSIHVITKQKTRGYYMNFNIDGHNAARHWCSGIYHS